MSGDVTEQALVRLSHMPDRSGNQGMVIAGQNYDDVYFTGGTITGVDVSGDLVTATGSLTARTLADRFGDYANILDFGGKPYLDGTTSPGNSSSALTAALATGKTVIIPASYGYKTVYDIGDVIIPSGASIVAASGLSYSTAIYSNVIFRRQSGCTTIFNVADTLGYYVRGICFDGVDRTSLLVAPIGSNKNSKRGTFDTCTFRYGTIGFGHGTNFMQSMRLLFCVATENGTHGISNLVDSFLLGCTSAGNLDNGVNLQSGMNDNSFVACKVEFNAGYGYNFASAAQNNVMGGIVDHNNKAGVRFSSADSITISNVVYRRNGRTGTSGARSHFAFDGGTNITITGGTTLVGTNDDGSGGTTPLYAIEWVSGTPSNVNFVGVNLTGYTTSATNGTAPSIYRIEKCPGAEDVCSGYSINCRKGRVFQSRGSNNTITPAGTATFNMTQSSVSTSSNEMREVLVVARNKTSGADYRANFTAILQREGSGASFAFSSVWGEVGTAGAITIAASGTVANLVFNNIATDGSTFDIVVTNNAANDISVQVEFR